MHPNLSCLFRLNKSWYDNVDPATRATIDQLTIGLCSYYLFQYLLELDDKVFVRQGRTASAQGLYKWTHVLVVHVRNSGKAYTIHGMILLPHSAISITDLVNLATTILSPF